MGKQLANELIDFIYESPTSFHAVLNAKKELQSYFIFVPGNHDAESGFRIRSDLS